MLRNDEHFHTGARFGFAITLANYFPRAFWNPTLYFPTIRARGSPLLPFNIVQIRLPRVIFILGLKKPLQ